MLSPHMSVSKSVFVTLFFSVYRQNMIYYPPRAILEGGCRFDRWFFRAGLAKLLSLQMMYIFLNDKIRKILHYLSSASDPPAINDWKRG